MSYSALSKMSNINFMNYGIKNTVSIPNISKVTRKYGKDVLLFIRENCENLCFDLDNKKRAALKDSDGKSSEKKADPL